jgi:hypothetical protein
LPLAGGHVSTTRFQVSRAPGPLDSTNDLEGSASDQQRCCKCAAKKNQVNIDSARHALLSSAHRID